MKKVILLVGVLVVFLIGCATPYQSSGFRGGFDETRLDDNSFMVDFRGNGFTSKERAYDFTLLRSAELTLEHGYKYFIIVSGNEYSSEYTTQSYSTTDTKVNVYGNTANAKSTTKNYGGYTISKPSAKNIIVCFEEKPTGQILVYNAKYVMKDIGKEYGVKIDANLLGVGVPYVGASNSNIYHLVECRFAKNIAKDKLVYFDLTADARNHGYRPCKVCKP